MLLEGPNQGSVVCPYLELLDSSEVVLTLVYRVDYDQTFQLYCVSESNAEPHCMRASLSLYTWTSANPMPWSPDASVSTTIFTWVRMAANVGEVSAVFVFLKSSFCFGSQTHGVSFCSN